MAKYQSALDVDSLVAIDAHVHIENDGHDHSGIPREIVEASAKYFRAPTEKPTLAQVAAYYRERRIGAVVFTVDAQTFLGSAPLSSYDIASQAADQADILIPFGSVDPLQGQAAIDRAYDLVETAGVRGFKLHPGVQGFDPNAESIQPLWEAFARIGLPVVVHTGQTGIGAGTPGAFGIRLRTSNPMLLDDVLADFPGLTLILAHPSVPWADEQISVMTHKTNAWMDLSGWSPKYFPAQTVRAMQSIFSDRVLFGSDYPLLSPDRWLSDFEALEIKDAVRPKILKDNAVRLLGLA